MMHRSYNSILPTHSKLLQQRWDAKYYAEHIRKVQEAIPVVDSKAPKTFIHLHLKLKKLQLEEERLETIERDNRILLDKMSHIMKTSGRIDNCNNYEYKSLNRVKRQRELLRVTHENQEILKRINMRRPLYSVAKWSEEWKENLQYMDNISAFPKEWWIMDKNGKVRSTHRDHSRNNCDRDEIGKDKDHDENDVNSEKLVGQHEGQKNVNKKDSEKIKKRNKAKRYVGKENKQITKNPMSAGMHTE